MPTPSFAYPPIGRPALLAFLALLATPVAPRCLAGAGDSGAPSFARDIRPILVSRCVDCHSGERPSGGLDLTTRAGILRGAESGRVVDLADVDGSLLLDLVDEGGMPPKKADRLGERERGLLRRWIADGMSWEGGPILAGAETTDRRAGLDWWSLRPVVRPEIPRGGGRNPIDAFIRAKLDKAGLKPAPQADRRVLIRRMTFDLHGLPPTPEEVEAFVADRSPDAVERLVDRLLASPRHGERWARHWLDVVRFAESHGYEHDDPRPNAWPYRDYVIDALNRDKPYDRFVAEQIAGDVLDPTNPQAVAATGFLVAGPYDQVGSKVTSALMRANVRQDELEDLIGVTGQAFLGLTLQCARCHDHKFDPIKQDDYYRLQAAFAGVRHGGPEADKPKAYVPRKEVPAETRILSRGDVQSPLRAVLVGFPRAVPPARPELPDAAPEQTRRVALAEWLTDPRNPLTARVLVNRVWQHHFGQGIVATPSDFGFNGAPPSHPELLDWLAREFMDGGWTLKRIHRLIMTSDVYLRSGRFDAEAAAIDADARLLWRFPPRRLDAEEIRDAILAVSGSLNPRMGGKGFNLFDFKTNAGTLYRIVDRDGFEYDRRSIYRTVVRGTEAPLLLSFDCPDACTTTPARAVTTTPLQALSLWNDRFVIGRAARFAARLEAFASRPAERVALAYALAFGRPPSDAERDRAEAFVARRGLSEFCRVLFNASEFLTID